MPKPEPHLSLSDEARVGRIGPRPRIEMIADDMPADLRAEYVVAINDVTVPASGLSRALARRGFNISANMISHYRRSGRVVS